MNRTEITLGGKSYTVNCLDFDQLEEVMRHFVELAKPGVALPDQVKAAKIIVTTALSHALADGETLKGTFQELMEAVKAVAKVTGMTQLGETMAQMKKKTLTSETSPHPSAPKPDGHLTSSGS